uniref:NADH dehydrogenase [ubiquinone] iron-sulfur protein 5 n=1 Tax=Coturnix japonica TaxID=93934 RepID=A0A8C2SNL5_COTJA
MPFWDLQRQLGIDVDRWLLRQSTTQPYGMAGACHAFEREWVECGHGLGQTRAQRECQPEYQDFMECMHRTKTWLRRMRAVSAAAPTPPAHNNDSPSPCSKTTRGLNPDLQHK